MIEKKTVINDFSILVYIYHCYTNPKSIVHWLDMVHPISLQIFTISHGLISISLIKSAFQTLYPNSSPFFLASKSFSTHRTEDHLHQTKRAMAIQLDTLEIHRHNQLFVAAIPRPGCPSTAIRYLTKGPLVTSMEIPPQKKEIPGTEL